MSAAELADKLVNRVTWKIPNALALVGSRAGDERNAMTTSWITQLSMEPVLLGVGVENTAVTHRLITSGGSFSVNLWDAANTRPFVKFSKPAAYEATAGGDSPTTGSLNGWGVFEASTGAPIFVDAAAWMDCEVCHSVNLGTHTLFVGEIVAADIVNEDVTIASMSDTRMKYGGVKRH